jgi:CheY-like chemotaxis protein
MADEPIYLLLADDDDDDRLLFEEALKELPLSAHLTMVNDGEELMVYLNKRGTPLPLVIFLDLNIAKKNGIECLHEIKNSKKLKHLPVIMYSTSAEFDIVNLVYKNGAQHYIRKPSEYYQLKKVIYHALAIIMINKEITQPLRENFVITGDY